MERYTVAYVLEKDSFCHMDDLLVVVIVVVVVVVVIVVVWCGMVLEYCTGAKLAVALSAETSRFS